MKPRNKQVVGYVIHYQSPRGRHRPWQVFGKNPKVIVDKDIADAEAEEYIKQFSQYRYKYKAMPVYLIPFINDETSE